MGKRIGSFLACLAFAVLSAVAGQITYTPNCTILLPTADVSTTAWVPINSGSHYAEVDEPLHSCIWGGESDGDTTYLSGATSCTTCDDTFEVSDWAACDTANKRVLYVAPVSRARRPTGITGTFYSYIVVGGTSYGTTSFAPSASYTDRVVQSAGKLWTNPVTGLAWTCAEINALRLRITKTATSVGEVRVTGAGIAVIWEDEATTLPTTRIREVGGD